MLKISNNQQGFTLLEIMIAIVLLSFIMIGVYSFVENGTNTKDRIISEDREMLQVQTALNRFAIDFSQIYSPLFFSDQARERSYYTAKGLPGNVVSTIPDRSKYQGSERFPLISVSGDLIPSLHNPDKSTFGFMTASNRRKVENARQSRYAWVLYELRNSTLEREERKADFELVRTFIPNDIYAGEYDWEQSKQQVLLENVKSLEFNFWNKESRKYVDSLRSLNEDQNIVRGLLIKLTWVDQNDVEREITRSFRHLWPAFDAAQDELEKYGQQQQQQRRQ